MPGFVHNILTIAEMKGRTAKPGAKAILDTNGLLYKYDAVNSQPNDDYNVIKPTSVGSSAGAWVINSRRTRYYNKAGEITSPTKVFMDIFVPTSAQNFVIDISRAGFTNAPTFPIIEAVRTSGQTANNAPMAKIKSITSAAITVDIIEPNTASLNVVGIQVGAAVPLINAAAATIAATVLYVRVEGV